MTTTAPSTPTPPPTPLDFSPDMGPVWHYVGPWLAAIVAIALGLGLIAHYARDRVSGYATASNGFLMGGLLATALGVGAGILGYVRLDDAVRPYGLTAGGVILLVVLGGALWALSESSRR